MKLQAQCLAHSKGSADVSDACSGQDGSAQLTCNEGWKSSVGTKVVRPLRMFLVHEFLTMWMSVIVTVLKLYPEWKWGFQ